MRYKVKLHGWLAIDAENEEEARDEAKQAIFESPDLLAVYAASEPEIPLPPLVECPNCHGHGLSGQPCAVCENFGKTTPERADQVRENARFA